MLKRAVFLVVLGGLLLLHTHAGVVRAAADHPLQGVWQVMDVGGQTAAGMYIFTGKHYSMMFAATDRPQMCPRFATRLPAAISSPTIQENVTSKREVWIKPTDSFAIRSD